MTRPDVPIPESPQPPFPVEEHNVTVIAGFGRGSAELGIPTANISTKEVKQVTQLDPGVYFGWVKLHKKQDATHSDIKERESGKQVEYSYGLGLEEGKDLEVVLPTVMSIGWNPFYGNKEKAIELHIVHQFPKDFYGATVCFNVLGYIRPELNYTTKGMLHFFVLHACGLLTAYTEALIKDIQTDIEIGVQTLNTPQYQKYKRL